LIDLHLYLGFVLITVLLGLVPGPNLALIIANSVAHGPRYGLMTVAGTVSAQVIQLIAVSLGLTALLESLGVWFTVLRWLGVIYLLWLGYRQWCAPPVDLTQVRGIPYQPEGAVVPGRVVPPVHFSRPSGSAAGGDFSGDLPGGAGHGRFLLGLGRGPGANSSGAAFPAAQPAVGRHADGGGRRPGHYSPPLSAGYV
jgi:hypothetical protein